MLRCPYPKKVTCFEKPTIDSQWIGVLYEPGIALSIWAVEVVEPENRMDARAMAAAAAAVAIV
jgi:hypothetical protein